MRVGALPIVITLSLFGIGGGLLAAGVLLQSSTFMFSSGGVSGAGLIFSAYLCFQYRKLPPSFEPPAAPPRIYRDPSMKRNKSDTDLQLIGAVNTTDELV